MFPLSSQHHSFDIALAAKYGVEEAILIHHFQHWIRINRRAKRNIIDGKCWSYQSSKEIQMHFPYWNVDRVKYLSEKLREAGVLIAANYNKIKIDKTLWYAFADERAFGVDDESLNNLYERQNCPSKGKSARPEGKSAQPIPDTIPDAKTQIEDIPRPPVDLPKKSFELSEKLLDRQKKRYPKMKDPKLENWASDIEKIYRLDKHSWEEIEEVLDWSLEDSFWCKQILSGANLRKHFDRMCMQKIPLEKGNSQVQVNRKLAVEAQKILVEGNRGHLIKMYAKSIFSVDCKEHIFYDMDPVIFKQLLMKYFELEE